MTERRIRPSLVSVPTACHLLLLTLKLRFSCDQVNVKYRTGCSCLRPFVSFSTAIFITRFQILAMDETDEELLILWFLTGAAVAIMVLRLVLRRYRKQRLELGDHLTIAAIISLLLRGAVIHVALVWGTNSITAAVRAQLQFASEEIYRREAGSKLTIVNRVFYTV